MRKQTMLLSILTQLSNVPEEYLCTYMRSMANHFVYNVTEIYAGFHFIFFTSYNNCMYMSQIFPITSCSAFFTLIF